MTNNKKPMDTAKIEIVSYIYKQDWHRMGSYDNDQENITWHVTNCMNYIILTSEDVKTTWLPPPDCELGDDWTEHELLALYNELIEPAVQAGYCADAGMVTRIRKAFAPTGSTRVKW